MTSGSGMPAGGAAPSAGGDVAPAAATAAAGRRPPRGLGALLEWISAFFARITAALCIALTAGFIFCLLLQIVCRYALEKPLSWTDEAAVFLFVWTMLLLASLGVREKFHVRLSALIDSLPPGGRRVLESLLMVIIIGFGGLMVMSGMDMVDLVWGNSSAALRYPMQALYLALPVSGVLVVLHGLPLLVNGNFET